MENLNNNIYTKLSAILFLYNDSININTIKEFLEDENITTEIIKDNIKILNDKLAEIGLVIIENNLKNNENIEYSLAVKKELGFLAKKIKEDELSYDLTPAALQVLTICAYLGACTKNEISFIRGIQSSQSIRSLSVRGLIKKVGDKYVLSIDAIQRLGITKINDLPEYEKISNDFKERLKEIMEEDQEKI